MFQQHGGFFIEILPSPLKYHIQAQDELNYANNLLVASGTKNANPKGSRSAFPT